MATWEDGPEYAPVERPADFSVPAAAPLEVVAPEPLMLATAPVERPAFDGPAAPVPELARLEPAVTDERDPAVPFNVVSSTVTSMDSAWGAAHWSTPAESAPATPLPSAPPLAGPTAPGPATTASWPPPTAPFPAVGGPAAPVNGFPPPGTPGWFGPGPVPVAQPAAPVSYDMKAVLAATTPGLCICLGVGGLISFLAPAMLVVAYYLATRVAVAQRQVRQAAGIAIGVLALVGVLTFLLYGAADGYWWSVLGGWARAVCWLLLGAVLALVRAALKRRAGASFASRFPPPWQ
jgi:hypothetical protein